MKQPLILLTLNLLALGATAGEPVSRTMAPAPAEAAPKALRHIRRVPSTLLVADFTAAGYGQATTIYCENFDRGLGQWLTDPTGDVSWSLKKVRSGQGAMDFASIDSSDLQSLVVEGPYQTFKRAKSSATSPVVKIKKNATLTFYVGFTLNYEDMCSLTLSAVCAAEETELWRSADEAGEKPWQWRKIQVDLGRYEGQDVAFKFTYGPGTDDIFQTGGYMGSYAIDGFSVETPGGVDRVELLTGEFLQLVNTTQGGECKALKWTMPGATPPESTDQSPEIYYSREGEYDITLEVTDSEGNTASKTRTAFVSVAATAPQARILPPATFRLASTRKPLIAPLNPVVFADASSGFPSQWDWTFTGVSPTAGEVYTSCEETPAVGYSFLHDQLVGLTVGNSQGTSTTSMEISVEYSGVATNMTPADRSSEFNMEDWGIFPGSNKAKITAYAEKFSAPSVPAVCNGAYVYFTRNRATALTDQLADIGVHLYTCENGLPGRKVDSMWWHPYELDMPSGGQMVGTAFPFDHCPVVSDEFFIVVDGLPEFNDSCCVSFAMAGFRPENSAYIFKDNKWMAATEYFGAGKGTSFMVCPSLLHSVMSALDGEEKTVGSAAGKVSFEIFSILGYDTPVETSGDWLKVVGVPNGLTVDTVEVAYDALPSELNERQGEIALTDGISTLKLTVRQNRQSAISEIGMDDAESGCHDLQGRRVDNPSHGVFIKSGSKIIM